MDVMWLAGLVGFGTAGLMMGAAGRLVLGRLARGVVLRPPWCELSAGGLSLLVGWRALAGSLPWWWLPVPLLLGWLAVPLVAADLARARLPDAFTLPAYPLLGLAVGVAAMLSTDPALGPRALAGVLTFGGAHLGVYLLAPRTLGAGDVKLAGSLGAVLGAIGWVALVAGAVLASVVTLAVAAVRRARAAPHGPGLLLATWLLALSVHR